MKRIFLDKISSATYRLQLNPHALISDQIEAKAGAVVAADNISAFGTP